MMDDALPSIVYRLSSKAGTYLRFDALRRATMPTYRSDVIGSLLRPDYLKLARRQRQGQAIDAAAFKRIEDRAVDEAVALQSGAGLEVITDGEMRRYAFYGHFIDSVAGFDKEGGWAIPFRDEQGHELVLKRPLVVAPLKRLR